MRVRIKSNLFHGASPYVLVLASVGLLSPIAAATAVAQEGEQAKQSESGPVKLGPVRVGGEETEGYKVNESDSYKFTVPLVDVPKTVTVITSDLIKERGASSLTDVLRTTPGITLGAGEGGTPLGDRPFIRGYEASTDMFIDGMRDLARTTHESFNIEQIEIVKGSGSTITGRGSTGGSINMVSKRPHAGTRFDASLQVGTDNTKRGTVDINYQVAETVAFRLNAMGHDADVAGRDAVDVQRWGVAPSVTFGLNTDTRVTLSYYGLRTDDTPDLGIPFSGGADPDQLTPPKVDRSNFYGYKGRDFRKVETDLATIMIEHDFSDVWSLRNVSRYARTYNDYIVTRPSFSAGDEAAGLVTTAVRNSRRHSESLFNQTDLAGKFETGGIKHNFAAGLEISRERLKSGGYASTGNSNGKQDLYNPDPHAAAPGVPYTETPYGDLTTTKTKAAYLADTIEFDPQWLLNLGVRFDEYDIDVTSDSRKDNIWSYNVGLIFKPAENGSIYVSYGTSANPSGETAAQSGGADGAAGGGFRDLKPEKSRSIELGTKWELFDNQLALTAALFETKKTDARSQDPVTGDIVLSGNNRTRGVEFGAAGRITPEWQVWASYTYLDPKILKYRSGGVDFDGNVMKFVAKQNFGLWTTYDVTPEFSVGGGANFTGKRFVNDANTYHFKSTWRFDATASYKVTENIDLRLNVLNLTNERIYDASHVGLFAVVAPGRSGLLTANVSF